MKKLILFFIFLNLFILGQAQVYKTINLSSAGSLSTTLTTNEKNTITNLTVTGTINAIDFVTMRDNMPLLEAVNLSSVTILSYTGTLGPYSCLGNNNTSYPINAIPLYAFYNGCTSRGKTSLRTIILPNSVTSIGGFAFYNCSGLISITIPNSVTSIVGSAFGNCYGLTSVTISNSITSIDGTFFGCSGLTSITIPNSVTSIGAEAFYCFNGSSGLTSITIGNSVLSIGSMAFYQCSGLTSLTIPNSVTSIGDKAFSYCSSLTSLIIGNSVTSIGDYAFLGCTALTSIYADKSIPVNLSSSTLVFNGVNKTTCILNVPFGSKSAYQTATQWKDFANIIEMGDFKKISLSIGLNGYLKENGVNYVRDTIISIVNGTKKDFTIIPNNGYEIATLTFNGLDIKSQLVNNIYSTPLVGADAALTVTFKKIQYQLSIKSAESGLTYLICENGATPSFGFSPANGWKIHMITFKGTDVTNNLVNGIFNVPALTDNVLLNVSFELIDGVQIPSNSSIRVSTTQSDIIIDGTMPGEEIALYTIGGVQLQKLKANSTQVILPINQSGVYLVKTASKTVKVTF